MKLELLVEELRDISKKERLYHRTNFVNLSEILDTGTVESSYYNLKGENHWGLCLGRKATFSDIDKGTRSYDEISENIGNVEFIFFEKRLGANKNLRGVKKNPVSEYGTNYGYALNRDFKKYYKENWAKKKKEFAKVFDKEIRTYAKEKNFRNVRPTQEKIDRFKEIDDEIFDIIFQMGLIMGSGREGEERLTSKKRFSLPLDSRFFKIKLLNGSYRNYRRFMEDFPSTRATKLCKNIYKYKDLFVKNNNFKKIVQDPDFKEAIGRRKLLKEEVLVEELRDIPRKNKLYHRTNIEGLIGILEDGYLKPSPRFNMSLPSFISTGRKFIFSAIDSGQVNPKSLSPKVGSVELMIFRDRLGSYKELRGVKVKPISEYGEMSFDLVRRNFAWRYPENEAKENFRKFRRMIRPYLKKWSSFNEFPKELEDKLVKAFPKIPRKDFYDLFRNLNRSRDYTAGKREGEERLISKEGFKVPLKRDIIMIRLLPGFKEDIQGLDMYKLSEFKKDMRKHSGVFLKNEEYKKMVKFLEEY